MRSYSDLPEDIIVNTLSRLPPKSVGRCRCVSKSWRDLLSRPDFIRTHLHLSRNLRQESLLLISEYTKFRNCLYYVSLSNARHLFDEITVSAKKLRFSGHRNTWNWIRASCDGLLIVEKEDDGIFVLNPVTREIRKVPDSPFALDPLENCVIYGFGYDSVNHDYKIVTISYDCDDYEDDPDYTEMFVDVYSLKSDTWKRAENSPYNHGVCTYNCGVFVNGCIHWLAGRTTDCMPTIVAFDLAEEKFREVPPPSSIGRIKSLSSYLTVLWYSYLTVLGGRLCSYNERQADVWVMEEYGVGESWTKFTINEPDIVEIRPLCMLGQEVLLKDVEKLVVYNLEEGIFKGIVIRRIQPNGIRSEASFVESLVSPNGTDETGRE